MMRHKTDTYPYFHVWILFEKWDYVYITFCDLKWNYLKLYISLGWGFLWARIQAKIIASINALLTWELSKSVDKFVKRGSVFRFNATRQFLVLMGCLVDRFKSIQSILHNKKFAEMQSKPFFNNLYPLIYF